jgi:hypothetical protein
MESNRIQGIPHAFIIGKDGQTAWHGHPMELEEHLLEAVEKVHLLCLLNYLWILLTL